jgi:hypothetical protein
MSWLTRSKNFFEVQVYNPAVSCLNVTLRARHGLMGRAPRTEAVTGIREGRVPLPLQHLQHRLLNESVKRRGNAELAHATAVRLGYLDPPHRLGLVGSFEQ